MVIGDQTRAHVPAAFRGRRYLAGQPSKVVREPIEERNNGTDEHKLYRDGRIGFVRRSAQMQGGKNKKTIINS